jgi:hypothetical protein
MIAFSRKKLNGPLVFSMMCLSEVQRDIAGGLIFELVVGLAGPGHSVRHSKLHAALVKVELSPRKRARNPEKRQGE